MTATASHWQADVDLQPWWYPPSVVQGRGPEVSRLDAEADPTIRPPRVIGFGTALPTAAEPALWDGDQA